MKIEFLFLRCTTRKSMYTLSLTHVTITIYMMSIYAIYPFYKCHFKTNKNTIYHVCVFFYPNFDSLSFFFFFPIFQLFQSLTPTQDLYIKIPGDCRL